MIISGEKALPDHLLQTSLDQGLNEDWQSTQESTSEEMQRPSTLELGQKDANVTFVKSPVPIRDLKDAGKRKEDSTQSVEMRNLSVRELSPIAEEVLSNSQRESIIRLVGQIITEIEPPSNVDTALSLLNERLGLPLLQKILTFLSQ